MDLGLEDPPGEQRMLALLLDRTEQGFWFIDNALVTTDANPAMCRMLGTTRGAMLGKDIYAFVDDANAAVFRHQVRLRVQGQAEGYEITLRRADGTPVHCWNNATPIYDVQGQKTGAVGMFSDITALKQAEGQLRASEARFRSMADGAPAFIWQSDVNGAPRWFNQRWLAYTGRSLAEELALDWGERMDAADLSRCAALFEQSRASGQGWNVEYRARLADGTWRWIADQGIPQRGSDGRLEGFMVYGWDITERKAGEAALIAAKDEAVRANRAKSEFLSRMSHELRTPLNAVLGFAQLLDSDPDDPLSGPQRARVQELLRGGRHLLALINEVLDLSRIEAGALQLHLEPVALNALVGECVRMVHPMAQERRIALHVLPPDDSVAAHCGTVLADATRLRQVLLNLLSNAIKYNRNGGEVELSWRADGDSAVRIEVRDSGPGLSAAQQERLFQAFERLDAEGSEIEGAGIGLALSKWLVNLMRGEIGVDSTPGLGSTFWVRLESTDSAHVATADAAAAEPTPSNDAGPTVVYPATADQVRTVLYVEDNMVNQLLMEGMLARRAGTRLVTAVAGPEGLAMATSAPPDLVLLDIQLPGMDGYEVLKRLRELPATRGVPVIAVSANAMPADLEQARQAGFDDYVTKPLELGLLLAALDKALGAQAAEGVEAKRAKTGTAW